MMFQVLLYTSLTVFAIGSLYRISRWFTRRIGPGSEKETPGRRLAAAAAGIGRTVFSKRLLDLVTAFVTDVLLLRKTWETSRVRWLMHMLIFYGFLALLLMHALERFVSIPLFDNYYSTLNPYLFLRDLFGVMVLAGIGIAVWRRISERHRQLPTGTGDALALGLIAAIIITGILYEGAKISSYDAYSGMVDQYAMGAYDDELAALEAYWVAENGTVSPNVSPPFSAEVLETGRAANDMYCAYCHAPMPYAFAGFTAARAFGPVALSLDRLGFVNFFWYAHFLVCFIGLAYIPFSKMFHMIATPVNLLAAAVPPGDSPANAATRRAVELDACTHCGTCSTICSARMAHVAIHNPYILPSEKLAALKRAGIGNGSRSTPIENALLQGVYICTSCERCTNACPSGIDLNRMWVAAREALLHNHPNQPVVLSPLSFVRGLTKNGLADPDYRQPLDTTLQVLEGRLFIPSEATDPIPLNLLSGTREIVGGRANFTHCFQCRNCTTICPVVGYYPEPEKALGLLPHQIMTSLGLGLVEMAAGSKMIWNCVTCYKCQEYCPQHVHVCDILYRLKNLAAERAA